MALLTDAQVADELAIRDLTQRFTDAVNRSATAEMAALFAPDGRWEVPGVTDTVGHDAIAARLAGLLAQFSLLVQLLHSGVVVLAQYSAVSGPSRTSQATPLVFPAEGARRASPTRRPTRSGSRRSAAKLRTIRRIRIAWVSSTGLLSPADQRAWGRES